MEYLFDTELSERELVSIGAVIALWGSLEYEIFAQTLMSFDMSSAVGLPKDMNNLQFSKIFSLWETRVVNNIQGIRRKTALPKQLVAIRHYYEYRNALAHGMWNWSRAAP
jgi:hypothetical protein